MYHIHICFVVYYSFYSLLASSIYSSIQFYSKHWDYSHLITSDRLLSVFMVEYSNMNDALGPIGGIVSTSINHVPAFKGCEIHGAMKNRQTTNQLICMIFVASFQPHVTHFPFLERSESGTTQYGAKKDNGFPLKLKSCIKSAIKSRHIQ